MRKSKKFIMFLLAFLIAYNMPDDYKADITYYRADQSGRLVVGEVEPTPTFMTTTVLSESAFLYWDLGPNGVYKLDYPISSGASIEFIFDKKGTYAEVSYSIWDHTVSPPAKKIDPDGYKVNIGNYGGVRGFVTSEEYIDKRQSAANNNKAAVYNELEPRFTVLPGTGFSFQYVNQNIHNQTVHFMWDAASNRLMYYTECTSQENKNEGILLGNIYPFRLTVNGEENPKEFIFNGIMLDQLTSTPIDKDGNKVNVDKNGSNQNGYPPIRQESEDGDDDPGTSPVGLIIDFPIPNIWDDVEKRFKPLSNTSDLTGNLKAIIELNSRFIETDEKITLTSNNFKNSPENWTVNSTAANKLDKVELVTLRTGDFVRITLKNLAPGMIFEESVVSITGDSIKAPDHINVPDRRFFTFPHYWVHYDGERYIVYIEPYKGFAGIYKLLEGYGMPPVDPPNPALIPDNSASYISSGSEQIIPLPVTVSPGSDGRYYQVFFIANGTMYSQVLYYKPWDGNIELGSPTFLESNVVKMDMVHDSLGNMSGNAGLLELSLRWDLGSKKAIDDLLGMAEDAGETSLDIIYEAAFSTTWRSSADNINLTKDIKISITRDENDASKLMASYEGVGVKNLPDEKYELIVSRDPISGTYHYYLPQHEKSVHISMPTAHRESIELGDLEFPNIYYVKIRPKWRTGLTSELDVQSSPEDTFTLEDFLAKGLPAPHGLTASDQVTTSEPDKNQVSFTSKWSVSGNSLREYIKTVPEEYRNNTKYFMNLYVSMDEGYMRDRFGGYSYDDRQKNGPEPDFKTVKYNSNHVYTEGFRLYFSQLNNNNSGQYELITPSGYTDAREALRQGKTVMVSGLPVTDNEIIQSDIFRNYIIDGLDKNAKYYVYVDFEAKHYDANGNLMIFNSSNTSNLVGVTTLDDSEIPTGEEKIPSAPGGLSVKSNELGYVTIQWDKVAPTSNGEVLEYQIIRLTSSQMGNEYLDKLEPYENFWNIYLKDYEKLGLKTFYPSTVEVYDSVAGWTGNFVQGDPYPYDAWADTVTLTDKTVIPNSIYFYYVRTFKVIGESVTYSSWSRVNVTTDPIEGPTDLRVEINRNDYDPRTEIIISFDAPIPDRESLGKTYNLEYQLKKEGQDWGDHITMPPEVLLQSMTESIRQGYYHFEYKIKGLSHSSSYMVRVRMTDEFDGSLYSNVEQFRTEFVQEEFDQQQNLDDWLYYLEQELMKQANTYFWTTIDNQGALEGIIRAGMWNDLAAQSADAAVLLPRSNTQLISYLIPSDVLDLANTANRGFRIISGNNEIIIAPHSFDQNQSQAMADIIAMIRQNNITDYFLRITVNTLKATEPVNGEGPISDIINLSFDMVGTKTPIKNLDNNLAKEFENFVKEFVQKPNVVADLKARLLGNDNEALVRYINELVLQAKNEFLGRITSWYGNMISASIEVDSLQRPISVIAKGIDPSNTVRAYQRQAGRWINTDHSPYGDDYVIFTRMPGEYVFTGQTLNIPGMADMQNAGTLTRIITKYSLDDYLGKGGFDLQQNATRLMIVGSVARIMGAPKESDPYNWLSGNKNINLSQRNMNANITAQEAAYLAAALYEAKTGIRIDSVQIRNYNLTAAMSGLDERYLTYIRAAGELGIVDLNSFTPGAAITIKDALEMIDAVDTLL